MRQTGREKFHGSTMSDDELVREFSIRGVEARVAMLHHIDRLEDKGEIERSDLREATRKMALKRRLNQVHHLEQLAGK